MDENKILNRSFLCCIIVYIAASHGLAYLGITKDWSLYTSLAVSEGLLLLPILITLLCHRKNPIKEIRWRMPPLAAVPLVLLVTVCCYPLISLCNIVSMFFAGNTASEISMGAIGGPLWLNFLFMAVLPASVEEFMFRGVYYHGYRKYGVWKAVLLSGLLFGLMHMNINQFSYACVLGIIMALVVEATGSIWSSVLIHLTVNGFSVVMLWLERMILGDEVLQESLKAAGGGAITEQYTMEELIPVIIILAVMAAVGLALAGAAYYYLSVVCKRNEYIKALFTGKVKPEEKKRIISIGLVIAVLISVGYMFLYL